MTQHTVIISNYSDSDTRYGWHEAYLRVVDDMLDARERLDHYIKKCDYLAERVAELVMLVEEKKG